MLGRYSTRSLGEVSTPDFIEGIFGGQPSDAAMVLKPEATTTGPASVTVAPSQAQTATSITPASVPRESFVPAEEKKSFPWKTTLVVAGVGLGAYLLFFRKKRTFMDDLVDLLPGGVREKVRPYAKKAEAYAVAGVEYGKQVKGAYKEAERRMEKVSKKYRRRTLKASARLHKQLEASGAAHKLPINVRRSKPYRLAKYGVGKGRRVFERQFVPAVAATRAGL